MCTVLNTKMSGFETDRLIFGEKNWGIFQVVKLGKL